MSCLHSFLRQIWKALANTPAHIHAHTIILGDLIAAFNGCLPDTAQSLVDRFQRQINEETLYNTPSARLTHLVRAYANLFNPTADTMATPKKRISRLVESSAQLGGQRHRKLLDQYSCFKLIPTAPKCVKKSGSRPANPNANLALLHLLWESCPVTEKKTNTIQEFFSGNYPLRN